MKVPQQTLASPWQGSSLHDYSASKEQSIAGREAYKRTGNVAEILLAPGWGEFRDPMILAASGRRPKDQRRQCLFMIRHGAYLYIEAISPTLR